MNPIHVDTETLVPEDYYASICGSCGRQGTVTSEAEIGMLCVPCTVMWSKISSLAFCNCLALWGRHSLQCTLRIREHAS